MGTDARVGFHAAFSMDQGEARESGMGNALVGAYLARIGIPDRGVVYITSAPPSGMSWLTFADAERLGIEVVRLPANDPPQAKAVPPSPQAPSAPTVADADATLVRRVAANFHKRYGEAGMVGINESIQLCYARARELRTEASTKYCFVLDTLAGQFDERMSSLLHTVPMDFNAPKKTYERVWAALDALGLPPPARTAKLNAWLPLMKAAGPALAEVRAP